MITASELADRLIIQNTENTMNVTPRTGPWSMEKAWEWYNAQPWIRGCNYMPASCANRVDQWQEFGCEERFAEMERETALMEKDGFNAARIILGDLGFAVWRAEHGMRTGVSQEPRNFKRSMEHGKVTHAF